MTTPPAIHDLSLKGLELFRIYARTKSLQATAQETGLSVSTISHHLRGLEAHLGVALFDHSRRPMTLSPTGATFLRNITHAMQAIHRAAAHATAGSITDTTHLRIGTIADLDSDVTPALAVYLSRALPACNFLYHTANSHEITMMLQQRQLDLGIVTTPQLPHADLLDWPLLRDPFVAVVPVGTDAALSDILAGRSTLPFLQFSSDLIIAGQIEAQLRRLGITLPHKFECASNQTLMAMVAAGAGWTITTPLLFARARRFAPKLRMHALPGISSGRTLSLVAGPDCARAVVDLVGKRVRDALEEQVIKEVHAAHPWLGQRFALIQ